MSVFKPTPDERETLKTAVRKYAHEPVKSQLLASLDLGDSEYGSGVGDGDKLTFCLQQYLLHAQAEVRRDPNKKSAKLLLAKADALARKFHPDFSRT